ncbi:MAG: CBS domain-containing protein [Alphaproteobacteria bacterium]|jgi:CBS domain-containing protein|nr:CBS domain-containing protein [Alphaproteobacteria bacterium]MDP7191101.1 CBS domain-containing protein [Alphaproteobacteria bacterium]HJO88562.1 CBS domain-containing protein [Alphaproteobacteria bacterium]
MKRKIVPDVVKNQTIQSIPGSTNTREAAEIMVKHHISALLVTKGDKLEGIFTERDISVKIIAQGRNPEETTVAQVMTTNPVTISPNDLAMDALEKMCDLGFRHLPIVDGERIIGMVSIRDLYAAVQIQLEDDMKFRDAFIFGPELGER